MRGENVLLTSDYLRQELGFLKRTTVGFSFVLIIAGSSLFAQNVGIGTTNPQARLHIIVPSGFTLPLLQVETDGSASPHLIVLPDGKVGIGVANPSEALDVSGNVQFSGALMPGGDAGTAGFVLMSQGTGNPPVWVDTALLKDNWGSQVAVTQSPIVGDGTSANPIGLQVGTNAGDILIWNGTQWVIKSSPFDSVCGTAMANYIQKWTGSELCNSIIYDDGTRVGIGTSTPANSAILDISASDKGVLLPRLTLNGYYDTTATVTKPDTALLVYHKGAPSMPPGYYFWDGEKWRYLYSYNHTQVVFEEVVTPTEIYNNGWLNPSETITLEPSGKYVDFTGGAPGQHLFWLQLLPAGVLPSIQDGVKYTIEFEVLRQVLADDNGTLDSDEIYVISDSTNGFYMQLPDCHNSCCNGYYVGSFDIVNNSTATVDGFSYSTGPCLTESAIVIETDSAGSYVGFLTDKLNASYGGNSTVSIDPAKGLWLSLYRLSGSTDVQENYRIKRIKVRVLMQFR